jgi:hypothetical protein
VLPLYGPWRQVLLYKLGVSNDPIYRVPAPVWAWSGLPIFDSVLNVHTTSSEQCGQSPVNIIMKREPIRWEPYIYIHIAGVRRPTVIIYANM